MGCIPLRCALGLLCSHAPTERVPGLNACPWLPVAEEEGGNGGNSQAVDHIGAVLHGGIHITYTHTFFRARHDSVWCMSVSIMWGSGPNNRLNLGCHQRRGAAARAERRGGEGGNAHRCAKHSYAHYLHVTWGEGQAGSVGATCHSDEQHVPFHKVSSPSGIRRPS